ncbi:YbjN domain-containing protein [Jannaschia sp. LMIT008]|uniref:YbjN domain-containing protein n=1 Tax=Jannaschia maritima TaxID=3032585 RepID=UPI0028120BF2|nr:YbjN domain-containing protein [Jannaschia sp. LMIT008]
MTLRSAIAAGIAAGHLAAGPAVAQVIDARDPDALLGVIVADGYSAQLSQDSVGDPLIVIDDIGIGPTQLYFFGCSDGADCDVVVFTSAYAAADAPSATFVNGWNRDKLLGRAYVDAEGDPILEYGVNLHGGVTPQNWSDSVDWWRVMVEAFEDAL